MNIDSLQQVIMAVAQSREPKSVLPMIVRGLVEERDIALARIWLTAPGLALTCRLLDPTDFRMAPDLVEE